MIKNRYITNEVSEDLSEKMVFIGGPRQVGKTTLSKNIIAPEHKNFEYYNWDNRNDRQRILKSGWPGNATLLIFDEIHKYKNWKSFIKGEYDKLNDRYKFLVTGSARLDLYRKGGDSMMGRYHYYRLHPFSLAESCSIKNKFKPFDPLNIPSGSETTNFLSLDKFGGFPEPFIKQNSRTLRRWHNGRIERITREDIRDITMVRDLSGMTLFCDMLPDRAGSLLSINSLRKDLEVSHKALTNWLNIMESFYYCFRIYPFVGSNFRSLKKESKLFLWDWSEIKDEAARFENLIACHLLKFIHFLKDYEGYKVGLYYLRNAQKKEVDFLLTYDDKPWIAIEVKLNRTKVSPTLHYYNSKLDIPYLFQVVKKKDVDLQIENVRVISADRFLLAFV
ncbi:MAG: ATP-binding protein [Desulfobacteraceae bacterium]|nr:ATP-binding protein [Desulfobacteraceae bacterium]